MMVVLSSQASSSMFLRVDGIQGESVDERFVKQIEVISFGLGMSNNSDLHNGGKAGKGSFQDLTILKYLDKSSSALMLRTARGEIISEIELSIRSSLRPDVYLVIKLKNVLVSSISVEGQAGGDRITESVTFHYERIHVQYTFFEEGIMGGKKIDPFEWNIPIAKAGY